MPSGLTWWQARDYAIAGTPVRRMIWYNPIIWITHTTGLFYYQEEVDTLLASPASADTVPHIVQQNEFGALEFLMADWTTLPPGGSEPVLPPGAPAPVPPAGPPDTPPAVPDPVAGGYPPSLPSLPEPTAPTGSGGSGGSGGSTGGTPTLPTGGNGGGGIVVNPPTLPPGSPPPAPPPPQPFPPPIPFTPPTWDPTSLIALYGSGPALDVQGALIGGSIGLTWSCTAHIDPPHALTMVLGTSDGTTGSGPVAHTDPTTVARPGDIVTFVAVLFGGPAFARNLTITATKVVS